LKDLDLSEIVEDAGISAKNLKRPGVQRVIKTIRRLNRDGYSLRRICRELEKEGHLTKRGNSIWQPSTISKILRRSS